MCMMLDVPSVLEAQVADYEKVTGKSVQQVLIDYMQREFARVCEGRKRISRFREILSRQPRIKGEPYVFHRRDAYEEELA